MAAHSNGQHLGRMEYVYRSRGGEGSVRVPAHRYGSCPSTLRKEFPSTWRSSNSCNRRPKRHSRGLWRRCSPAIGTLSARDFYFAWDPLAAVALANPAVATFKPLAIEISDKAQDLGRTMETKKRRANVQVAIDADVLRFRDIFMKALESSDLFCSPPPTELGCIDHTSNRGFPITGRSNPRPRQTGTATKPQALQMPA